MTIGLSGSLVEDEGKTSVSALDVDRSKNPHLSFLL
jgi:hypothetical protein